jgi:serine/threonine protein kinase
MMMTHGQLFMDISGDTSDPIASTQGDSLQLRRLRRAVMARVFDDEVPTPERIGRYEIAGAIGSGAMGAVYAAHDPELDRRVAVKLLHWSNDGVEGKRLLREAKALAKLSHSNVVQVYDAGTTEDRVFLAMELVQGTDLHHWLRAEPRTWRAVVEVFIAAGRGLAAAHAVGLVHRDFKPQNVFVGHDGVVKVADFGLVSAAGGPAALPRRRASARGVAGSRR